MSQKIHVNDVLLDVSELEISNYNNDEKELMLIKFNLDVRGKSNYNLIKNLFKNESLEVVIPNESIEITATSGNSSHSYTDEMNEDTIVSMSYELKEIDKESRRFKKDTEIMAETAQIALKNWLRARALSELLIEKGIITSDELDDKYDSVFKRDYEELAAKVVYEDDQDSKGE